MDFNATKITLHPLAQTFLFEHYRNLRLIFQDVLGHFEIDYISITLLNEDKELLFLSSRPAIEQNLIAHHLWENDPCLQENFFKQSSKYLWHKIYEDSNYFRLNYYKLRIPRFHFGISIPTHVNGKPLIYSFALESNDLKDHHELLLKTEELLSIGRFCLQKCKPYIPNSYIHYLQPQLTIINNTKSFQGETI